MNKIIKKIELYLLLMLFWLILNGSLNWLTIFYGSIFSVIIIKLTYHIIFELDDEEFKLPSMWRFIWFVGIVFTFIVKSSLSHIVRIVKNQSDYVTFEVELDTKNNVILTLIANAITLTPGTITLDIVDSTLHVVGFARSQEDIDNMVSEVHEYYKPFK